jgi:hypothetical protein
MAVFTSFDARNTSRLVAARDRKVQRRGIDDVAG